MPTLQGIKPGSYRKGKSRDGRYEEATYTVIDATDPESALSCPGLPDIGDTSELDSELVVEAVETLLAPDSVRIYDVDVRWSMPGAGGPAPTNVQTVNWSFSTTTQKRMVDIDGVEIGETCFFKGRTAGTIERVPFADDTAEIGLDVLAGMVEAEVNKPVPSAFNLGNVSRLITRVNQAAMTVDGYPFLPREVMLVGASARRTVPAPLNQFEITYRLVMGLSELPSGVVKFQARDDAVVTYDTIPLGDGYVPMFEMRDKDGGTALTPETAAQKAPVAIRIHRLYPGGDFTALGVT